MHMVTYMSVYICNNIPNVIQVREKMSFVFRIQAIHLAVKTLEVLKFLSTFVFASVLGKQV